MDSEAPVTIRPFPRQREIVVDAGYLAAGRHIIHGLVEVDVTEARARLRALSAERAAPVSFTAYISACYGAALAAMPQVHAYRDWRGRLVTFRDVDIVVMVEPEAGRVAIPHVIRDANRKDTVTISDEIRAVQARPASSKQDNNSGLAALGARLPRWVRMIFYRTMRRSPERFRQISGTAVITSVGMFGRGGGFGLGFLPLHTTGLTVGGIATRPAVVEGEIVPREMLHLTLSFDHDIVDGAPAARFAQALVALLESGATLPESDPQPA